MVCRMASDINQFGFLTRPTLSAFEGYLHFDQAPLYAVLHETIYARQYESSERLCSYALLIVEAGVRRNGPQTES